MWIKQRSARSRTPAAGRRRGRVMFDVLSPLGGMTSWRYRFSIANLQPETSPPRPASLLWSPPGASTSPCPCCRRRSPPPAALLSPRPPPAPRQSPPAPPSRARPARARTAAPRRSPLQRRPCPPPRRALRGAPRPPRPPRPRPLRRHSRPRRRRSRAPRGAPGAAPPRGGVRLPAPRQVRVRVLGGEAAQRCRLRPSFCQQVRSLFSRP